MTRVDFAAVAAARSALRAIVARWPELSTPAAHARLAGALPEVLSMSRPIDQSRQSIQVGVRLTPDMATAVDREVSRLQGAAIGATIGRSDAIRGIILRWMADQARALTPAPQASPPALVEPEAPAIPSSTPAPSPPARATLALVEPSPAPQAPALVEPEVCDQCDVTITRTACASPGCSAVVSVCGCEASLARDGYCDQHAPKPAPQASPPVAAPLVLAPPPPSSPAAVDEEAMRAKLRRLQASESGRDRQWSNPKIATIIGAATEATVRRWLSGRSIESATLARLAAYLRDQPET